MKAYGSEGGTFWKERGNFANTKSTKEIHNNVRRFKKKERQESKKNLKIELEDN